MFRKRKVNVTVYWDIIWFWKELVRLAFGISRVVQLVGDRIVEINLTGAKESQEFIRRGAGYSNERISFSFLHSLEPTIH